MNEKRRPHYDLIAIKAAFADPTSLNRTFVSRRDATLLGIDDRDVAAVVQGLVSADFNKSMTTHFDSRTWQDVYRTKWAGRELYVKFTLDAQGALLLISFKEA